MALDCWTRPALAGTFAFAPSFDPDLDFDLDFDFDFDFDVDVDVDVDVGLGLALGLAFSLDWRIARLAAIFVLASALWWPLPSLGARVLRAPDALQPVFPVAFSVVFPFPFDFPFVSLMAGARACEVET